MPTRSSHTVIVSLTAVAILLFVCPAPTARCGRLTDRQRQEIQQAIDRNVDRLREEGRLAAPLGTTVLLEWPVRLMPGLDDPGWDFVSHFVDHDPAGPNELLDYNCGARTYDVIGGSQGSHRGTDIASWPFPWLRQQNNETWIIAAAAGTIVFKQDGNFDQNCECTGAPNLIAIRHVDGTTARYNHAKKHSLTNKPVGAGVTVGEYLGVVASSGCSGGPHLHFELVDDANNVIDPFAGPCNPTTSTSLWVDQRPYNDSAVNKIVIGRIAPFDPPLCAVVEDPREVGSFEAGETVRFTVYYRNTAGQTSTSRLYRPDDSLANSWTLNQGTLLTRIHAFQYNLPVIAQVGEWRIEVEYEGRFSERTFFVGVTPGSTAENLTLGKTPTGVVLDWGDTCGPALPTAGIHVGIIGNWYSHFRLGCDYTGGTAELDWIDVQGARYLLVAPVSDNREGSYGRDSADFERPPGTLNCFAIQAIGCP